MHLIELSAFLLLVLMLLCTFIGGLLEFAVKVTTSVLGVPNLSTHLVSLSLLFNRLGAAVVLLMVGYFLDTGLDSIKLIGSYVVFCFLLALIYFYAAFYVPRTFFILRGFIQKYYQINVNNAQEYQPRLNIYRPTLDVMIIFLLSIFGFLLPSVAASFFPNYRATLLQTGFVLNSVATLYSTFRIEKRLALIFNADDNIPKWDVYAAFLYSRGLGALLGSLFLFLYAFWIWFSP